MLGTFKRYIISITTSRSGRGELLGFDGNALSSVQNALQVFKNLSLCKERQYNKVKFVSLTSTKPYFFPSNVFEEHFENLLNHHMK